MHVKTTYIRISGAVVCIHTPPLYSVLLLQSLRSISTVPAITSSSSRASNTDTSLESTTWDGKTKHQANVSVVFGCVFAWVYYVVFYRRCILNGLNYLLGVDVVFKCFTVNFYSGLTQERLLKADTVLCLGVYLVEASDQRLCLLHHSSLHPPLGHPLYIIFLVLLSHLEVGATWLQLPLCHLATISRVNSTSHQSSESLSLRKHTVYIILSLRK